MLFANEREIVKGLLSDPPIFIGEDGISLDTGSPYQTPSRKDFEDEMKPGEGGPPADFDIKDFLVPVEKADASNFFNQGTGIEPEGFESVPDYLKEKLREMEWKKDLEERRRLGLEPVVS